MSAVPAPTASPAQTATREPTVTPEPTLSATPTRLSTPAPTRQPTPPPTPRPTPRPTATSVVRAVEAKDFAFSPNSLSVPAGVSFEIAFSNADAAIPHNVTIVTLDAAVRFSGKIVNGSATIIYAVPALPAGTYRLACIVHPAMTGTLTVH